MARRGSGQGWGESKGGTGFQEVLCPDWTGMHSSGTQTHVPQAHNAKRESSERVTTDGRNKEQGKAEGANRSRWPHSSVVPVPALTPADQQSPLTLPSAQAGISRIRSLQRANSRSWGPPPRHRGPKPGKGPIAGSESCKRSNCLPFQNLGSSLDRVGRGEHKGAMAPLLHRPPLLQGQAQGGLGG